VAANPLPLLDSDAHVAEPQDLWEGEYMEAAFRGAAPTRFVDGVDSMGRPATALWYEGIQLMESAVYGSGAGVAVEDLMRGVRYSEGNAGGWDPAKRLADMDSEGVLVQVVNPGLLGLKSSYHRDPRLVAAMCRAYNNWAADHCEATNGRVYANLLLPWQDSTLAMAELDRVSQRDCFRGVIMRPDPYPNGFIGDEVFEPLFAAIEERNLTLVLHTGTSMEGPIGSLAAHYISSRPQWHAYTYTMMLAFPMEAWMAWAQLVFEGVLDRHPNLRVMITESHGGWLVTALERMDKYAEGGRALRAAYQMDFELLPSEYFARQGFVVFESDEIALAFASEYLGRSMLWASDYPHADATFPGGGDEFRTNLAKLPESLQRGLAWENGCRAFGIDPKLFA